MQRKIFLLLLFPTYSLYAQSQPAPSCGNGAIDIGEDCDDGSANSDDYGPCTSTCKKLIPSACGNGLQEVGEQCDDGNQSDDDGCRGDCRVPRCGDKVVDAGEVCDDGNNKNFDRCNFDCSKKTVPTTAAPGQAPEDSSEDETRGLLDPDVALRRAVWGTFLGPPGLGVLYGPSLGHFYAGETGRGLGMTLARAAVIGINIGMGSALVNGRISIDTFRAITATNGLLLSVLVAVDLVDAPRAALRSNKAASQ